MTLMLFVQVGFGSLTHHSSQGTEASSQMDDAAALHKQSQPKPIESGVLRQTQPLTAQPLQSDLPLQQQSYPLQPDRASFPGSSEAGWQAFKPGLSAKDLKSAGSLPILQVSPRAICQYTCVWLVCTSLQQSANTAGQLEHNLSVHVCMLLGLIWELLSEHSGSSAVS